MKDFNEITNNNSVSYLKFKTIKDPKFNEEVEQKMVDFMSSTMVEGDEKYIAFGGSETEGESVFLFVDQSKVDKMVSFSRDLGILEEVKELSMDVLMNRVKNDDFQKTFESDEFSFMLDKFISENLTVDMVLDKINEGGMESLNGVDMDVLKNS